MQLTHSYLQHITLYRFANQHTRFVPSIQYGPPKITENRLNQKQRKHYNKMSFPDDFVNKMKTVTIEIQEND